MGRHCQINSSPRIAGSHHVLVIEQLRSKLRNRESTILLRTTGSERGKATDEEVKTWERNKVDSELTKIGVELTREPEGTSRARHDHRNEVVEISVGWSRQFECTEADIVQSFVVDTEDLIGGLDELMDRKSAIVRLDNSV
jgi:hypothetical protein